MKELKEQKLLSKALDYPKECFDESHNRDNCLTDDTKLVIVGTMTPKGFDYFYCAPRNRIFGYIDEAIGTNLKELKEELNNCNNQKNVKNKIIEELKKNKIAFVDVIKYVIRKENEISSHDDTAIEFYSIDDDAISKIKDNSIVICNSRFAQEKFCRAKKIDLDDKYYLPQRGKGSSKENWVNRIRNKLINSTATKILNEHKDAFKELAK